MLKKIFFFFFILCSLYAIENTEYIETERTLLIPWTIDHSREWEIIELQDNEPSYFCRNDYFESSDRPIYNHHSLLPRIHRQSYGCSTFDSYQNRFSFFSSALFYSLVSPPLSRPILYILNWIQIR